MPNFLQRLIRPFLLGAFFALLTCAFVGSGGFYMSGTHYHRGLDYLGEVLAIFIFPGGIIAIITSNNIHTFSPTVMVLGNFVFYFLIVYLLLSRPPRSTPETPSQSLLHLGPPSPISSSASSDPFFSAHFSPFLLGSFSF